MFTRLTSSCWIELFIIMKCPSLFLVTAFVLKLILSYIAIDTTVSFLFPFAWKTFLHTFTFIPFASFDLKWFSCREHMYVCVFSMHSATLCLFIGEFNPFTFKVIVNSYVLTDILLIVFVVILCSILCVLLCFLIC